ncbi:MAG TPA: Flp family type IVb pilin [Candidatus Aquilonibacter sp.]
MLKNLTNVLTNEDGATLVEYGLLVALIAAISIAMVGTLGKQVLAAFSAVSAKM